MTQVYKNNVVSVIGTPLNTLISTITVFVNTGNDFPDLAEDEFFLATLIGIDGEGNENRWEVVKVIQRNGDDLIVQRGQDNTTAQQWATGTRIELRVTAAGMERGETAYMWGNHAEQGYLNEQSGDDLFLTKEEADALYLSPEWGDELFLTEAEADRLFLTPAEGDELFLTQDEADVLYTEEAPTSGLVYGRANGTWVEVTGGEGGGGGTGGAGSVNLAYDKLTPNGTADTFDLTIAGDAREPLGATNLLVSFNGIIQEPGVAFTTTGSTITFTETPQAGDVIDFIVELTNGSHWELNGLNLEYVGEGVKVVVDQFQANDHAVFMGNVGIGTASPATSLDVVRAGVEPLRLQSTTSGTVQMRLANTAGNAFINGVGNDIVIPSGNVGIGTDNPTTELAVSGTCRVERVGNSAQYIDITTSSAGHKISAVASNKTFNIQNNSTTTSGITFDQAVASPYIFKQAGTESMRIDDSGNVGIGTTNPLAPLHTSGNTSGTIARFHDGVAANLYLEGDSSVLRMANRAGSGQLGFTVNNGVSDALRINSSGNVGINSTTPSRNLTIGGDTADTTHLQLTNATTGINTGDGFQISQYTSGAVQLWNKENSYMAFGTNNAERMRIDASGTTTVTGGFEAVQPGSGTGAFAAGPGAGISQGAYGVAVGFNAGRNTQGSNAVAIGNSAAETTQGANGVAIGNSAGLDTQGEGATAVGRTAGRDNQGSKSVAVGWDAGRTSQGGSSVAVGDTAGQTNQGASSVAVGLEAGFDTQGSLAVAYGRQAGRDNQGASSVAIGARAGHTNQGANGIIISSSGVAVNDTSAGHIIIKSSTQDLRSLPNGGFAMNRDPIIGTRKLISTLSTLRNATKDETTLEGMRDALADAIGGLIENLEHEIAAMPAPEPEPEVSTMPAGDES